MSINEIIRRHARFSYAIRIILELTMLAILKILKGVVVIAR